MDKGTALNGIDVPVAVSVNDGIVSILIPHNSIIHLQKASLTVSKETSKLHSACQMMLDANNTFGDVFLVIEANTL